MAKSNRKPRSRSAKNKTPKSRIFSRSSLVASASGGPMPADVFIDFLSGLGQATAVLFRKGLLINMQSISTSGSIHFDDVQSRDSIAVNGVCTGSADVSITVPTNPITPERFSAGIIIGGYTIK